MRVRFGEFELDEGRRQLLRGGVPTHVTAKEFLLLQILLARRPNAVSKQELYDTLWPHTFVSEVNLPSLIAELRAALGDDAHRPHFIRTVHGFGYAFCGEAFTAPDPASGSAVAILTGEGHHVVLFEGETFLGRNAGLLSAIADASVSRTHAKIVCRDGACVIRDSGSKNGTTVRGGQVGQEPVALRDGDVVTVGNVRLVFQRALAGSTITIAR